MRKIHVIGGGLAGSEAAWQIAQQGIDVVLSEMRPIFSTPVHQTGDFAELVCSNSFRSDDSLTNAVGLLHWELRQLDSLILKCADRNTVPAGGALAVDRLSFSQDVTKALTSHPYITVQRGEVRQLSLEPSDLTIVATGPLTSPALADSLLHWTGISELAFFDAIAPIVYFDSIDMSVAWRQSRYDKSGPAGTGADYINCPLTKDHYYRFIDALSAGEKVAFKEFETTPYFEGCLPIEVMAERGAETLRFGPLKPVGLTNPHAPDIKPYAIVQLRQDNRLGTLYNMVGFQTKLKHGEQSRIFKMIPGLERAEFARLGGLHRNTYLNSPKLLDVHLRLKKTPHLPFDLHFAGQITGCEGYVESTATGLYAGLCAALLLKKGCHLEPLPATTALGALINHITGGHLSDEDTSKTFQPMNVNFGLFPPITAKLIDETGKKLRGTQKAIARKQALSARAKSDMQQWITQTLAARDFNMPLKEALQINEMKTT